MIEQTKAMKLAQKWQQTDWNTESPMSADFAVSEAADAISALINALREALASEAIEQPAQRKPFAWANTDDVSADTAFRWCEIGNHKTPIYTSPPVQRTWVGLTEKEWNEIGCRSVEEVRIAVAVEAKLKEKNSD